MNAVEEIFGTALSAQDAERIEVRTQVGATVNRSGNPAEIPSTEAMSRLASRINANWRTNVDHRLEAGVDAKLRKAILAQTCNYTAEQKEKLRRAGISEEVYSPITNTKVRAAKALMMDLFQANGDYPFSLNPTSDPELPEQLEAEAMRSIEEDVSRLFSAVAAQGQMLTPQGEEMLKSMVSEAYRLRYDELQNRKEEIARNRARRMEKRVKDYFDEGGFVDAFQEYVNNVCTYGTGFIRGPIPTAKAVNVCRTKDGVPKISRELMVIPCYESVSPWDVYPAPDAKDIGDGPLCIRVKYSADTLHQYVAATKTKRDSGDKANGWMSNTVRSLLAKFPNGGCKLTADPEDSARRMAERRGVDHPQDCTMEGILYYDAVRGSELIEIGITMTRQGKRITEAEFYNVEAIVIGGYVVYCRILDDRLSRPIVKGVFYELPGGWWGESVADKLALCQTTMNNAIKALFRNMAAASGPMYWINDITRIVDRDGSGTVVKPHKTFLFQPSASLALGATSGPPMGVMAVPSNAKELLAVWEQMKTQADDDSGIPAYTYGQASGNSGAMRTAQGLAIFTEAASRGMKMVISCTDRLVTRRLVKMTVDYIMLYDPDFDIKGDCEVVPAGIMGKILKAQQDQQRLQLLQMVTNNQYLLQMVGPKGVMALLRPSVADVAINPDDVLPSEERVRELEKIQDLQAILGGGLQAQESGGEQVPQEEGAAPRPGSVAERRSAA